ncbi:MFS transporter [Oryzobacter sp. R7]|uniref:MFS transporter n=1 Tax=Oryzobacter faecalis TaxID=3388656 RepID=UPI00398D04B5
MSTTATLVTDTSIATPVTGTAPRTALSRRAAQRVAAVATAAALAGLGLMHFALDGLTSLLVPLQPLLASRTGASPSVLSLVVAVALAAASLLQPLSARLVHRHGERRVAAAGAVLAGVGYGAVPAAGSVLQAVLAVLVGGMGSSLFHPAAGALMARAARSGRESLPLAAFSAVGTAGSALVPFGVVMSIDALGWAAAVPVASTLVALTVAVRAQVFGPATSTATHRSEVRARGTRQVRLAVAAGAMVALAGTTVGASTAVLVASQLGGSHPAVPWVVAAYSASGAVGGMALAVLARRHGARAVLMVAVALGSVAAAAVPFLPLAGTFVAMAVAGAGLSGSLPLLVSHARRPGEGSAAGAVGRVLGLAAGLGGAGYAGVGFLQSAVGYGPALTGTVAVAGSAALAFAWFLCRSVDPADCADPLPTAATTCSGAGCGC